MYEGRAIGSKVGTSMFQRPASTYGIDFGAIKVEDFRKDDSSPLCSILELIPEGSKVLDIGAGNGILGWLIKGTKSNVVIDGIEPNPSGTELARRFYRKFYNSVFIECATEIKRENYDFVVLADVIEHVNDPLAMLESILEAIPKTCKIVLSIPNVGHYSVRLGVLNGHFIYTDSGLLERTHVRFFTLATIEEMVKKLNVHIEELRYLRRFTIPTEDISKYRLTRSSRRSLLKDNQAMTYQYLVVLGYSDGERKVYERGRVSEEDLRSIIEPRYLKSFMTRAKKKIKFFLGMSDG